jgi:hypothetical protein
MPSAKGPHTGTTDALVCVLPDQNTHRRVIISKMRRHAHDTTCALWCLICCIGASATLGLLSKITRSASVTMSESLVVCSVWPVLIGYIGATTILALYNVCLHTHTINRTEWFGYQMIKRTAMVLLPELVYTIGMLLCMFFFPVLPVQLTLQWSLPLTMFISRLYNKRHIRMLEVFTAILILFAGFISVFNMSTSTTFNYAWVWVLVPTGCLTLRDMSRPPMVGMHIRLGVPRHATALICNASNAIGLGMFTMGWISLHYQTVTHDDELRSYLWSSLYYAPLYILTVTTLQCGILYVSSIMDSTSIVLAYSTRPCITILMSYVILHEPIQNVQFISISLFIMSMLINIHIKRSELKTKQLATNWMSFKALAKLRDEHPGDVTRSVSCIQLGCHSMHPGPVVVLPRRSRSI